MTTTTHIKFGDGLQVTDEGGGTIRVDGQGGPAGATGPPGPAGPAGPPGTTPDISGKVDRDAVEAATNRLVQVKLAAGDTQPAFKIQGDGKHEWGPGGTSGGDTDLYRQGPGILKSDGQLYVSSYVAAFQGTANESALTPAGVMFAGGDTSLARYLSGYIKTPGGFLSGKEMWVNHDQPPVNRILIGHNGTVPWAVIVLGNDARVYRSTAGVVGVTMGALGDRDLVYGAADSAGAGYRTVRVAN